MRIVAAVTLGLILAVVPQLIVDIGIVVGVTTAVAGLIVAVGRSRPARWVWARNVRTPATEWLRTNVREEITSVVDPIEKRVWGIEKQVHPNGGASMPDRIEAIEGRCDTIESKLDELLGRREAHRWFS